MGYPQEEPSRKTGSQLPGRLHIFLIMGPQAECRNPMAISNFLNPSDDEDVDGGSTKSELGSVENSMDSLQISRRDSHPGYEEYHYDERQRSLPLVPIDSPQDSGGRQNIGFDSHPRHRHSLPSRDSHSDPRSLAHLHYRQHRRDRTSRHRNTPSTSPQRHSNRVNSKRPHSNKAYTPQQVAWIRYTKEDLNIPWKGHPSRFRRQFPEDRDHDRDSDQCFSSRYYRANTRPNVDKNWQPIFLEDGRPDFLPDPVRGRTLPEGKALDIPFTLVERHPERAIRYSWVSSEHKAKALDILRRDGVMNAMFESPNFVDPNPKDKKWRWRRVFRMLEAAGHLPSGG